MMAVMFCRLPCCGTVGGGWWAVLAMVYRCKYYGLHMTLFSHLSSLSTFIGTNTLTWRRNFILTFSLYRVYSEKRIDEATIIIKFSFFKGHC